MLKGYKTYILAAVAVIGAIASYLVGDATIMEAGQVIVTAVMAATIRNGSKTDAQVVVAEVKKPDSVKVTEALAVPTEASKPS